MTVRELIQHLHDFPPDMSVYYFNGNERYALLESGVLRVLERKNYKDALWEHPDGRARRRGPDLDMVLTI